jgi:hypothetical protein
MEAAAEGLIFKGGHKIKMQFENRERNTLNAIALLNKPQQLMLRTQIFTKIFVKAKECKASFIDKKNPHNN